jgi:hypothetical protein
MQARLRLLFLLFLLPVMVHAQRSGGGMPSGGVPSTPSLPAGASAGGQGNTEVRTSTLTIRVTAPKGQLLGKEPLRVQIYGSGSSAMGTDSYTDARSQVSFPGLPFGRYDLVITGAGIEDTRVTVDVTMISQTEFVSVKLRPSPEGVASGVPPDVPPDALKEFQKANDEAKQRHWDLAEVDYRKATELYPKFAMAFHNLGLACAQQQKFDCAADAWAKAIDLDPKSADSFISLARLRTQKHEFAEAETLLQKAIALQPANADAVVLLANAELVLGKNDEALAHARQGLKLLGPPAGGSVPQQFVLAHLVAGNALESSNKPGEAVAEYQAIVNAVPNSPAANEAQKAIARLQPPAPAGAK